MRKGLLLFLLILIPLISATMDNNENIPKIILSSSFPVYYAYLNVENNFTMTNYFMDLVYFYGGLVVGYTTVEVNGTLRYTNGQLQLYNGSWNVLGGGGGADTNCTADQSCPLVLYDSDFPLENLTLSHCDNVTGSDFDLCTNPDTTIPDTNCTAEGSCPLITYDSELSYIDNCSVTDSCANIVYTGELDNDSIVREGDANKTLPHCDNVTGSDFDLCTNPDTTIPDTNYSGCGDGEYGDGINKCINFNDTVLNLFEQTQVIYNATSFNVSDGILDSGNLSSIQGFPDNNTLNISEVSGSPGFLIYVNFTNVTAFNVVALIGKYSGGAGHTPVLELFRVGVGWEEREEITDQMKQGVTTFDVFIGSDFIDEDGTVQFRLNHDDNGIITHDYSLNSVLIAQVAGIVVGGGLGDLTGRDEACELLPDVFCKDGSKKMEGNLNMGRNNITNASLVNASQGYFDFPPTDTYPLNSTLVVNPPSATPNANLLLLGVASTEKFQVDEDGDLETTGDTILGGDLTMLGYTLLIGDTGAVDVNILFASSVVGILTWEQEDFFRFWDDVLIDTTKNLYFGDFTVNMSSSTSGQLDINANDIQIDAPMVNFTNNITIGERICYNQNCSHYKNDTGEYWDDTNQYFINNGTTLIIQG